MTTPKNPSEIRSNDDGKRLYLSVTINEINDLECALTNILSLRVKMHQAFGSGCCLEQLDFVAHAIDKVIWPEDERGSNMTMPQNPIEIRSDDEGELLGLSLTIDDINILRCALNNIIMLRLKLKLAYGSGCCLKPVDFIAKAIDKLICELEGHH